MNRIIITLVVLIVMLACLIGTALAGNNSYSIMVSCTIPAIPGVNVPLVEEEQVTEKQETPEEAQIEKEQLVGSENGNSLMLTRTIYSR